MPSEIKKIYEIGDNSNNPALSNQSAKQITPRLQQELNPQTRIQRQHDEIETISKT